MCRYWDTFLHLVNLLKFLVAADRNGDWDSHLQAIQNLLPVFREFDSINYLRYVSWYLEKMRCLEEEHPEVYHKFKAGNFAVRQTKRPFTAVSPDMKLEQTIQRSQKSSNGIIGQTRQQMYVTEWELVYHEVLGISNRFREILGADSSGYSESYVEHSLKEGERERRRNVDPIELIKIEQDTPIPIQMDRFWSSCKNKEMLQSATATSFIEKAKMANFTTVLSGTITGDNDSRDAKI
ncbi:hypothetical protein JTE90_021680 [Oedothorax gibbosus]|uniref:Uncharacterized protein n=1 Tax=Oedothorax gibbosus TaxID=931172 RepID=A0AAV6TP63_9ARAC|nr:hypothetical protein JTE90_021680 [Oedothorax gibbosus]